MNNKCPKEHDFTTFKFQPDKQSDRQVKPTNRYKYCYIVFLSDENLRQSGLNDVGDLKIYTDCCHTGQSRYCVDAGSRCW